MGETEGTSGYRPRLSVVELDKGATARCAQGLLALRALCCWIGGVTLGHGMCYDELGLRWSTLFITYTKGEGTGVRHLEHLEGRQMGRIISVA